MTLRVTVEIVPHGIEEQKRTIGVLNISNIGQEEVPERWREAVARLDPNGGTYCRYKVMSTEYGPPTQLGPTAIGEEWPEFVHRREDGFWACVWHAIAGHLIPLGVKQKPN